MPHAWRLHTVYNVGVILITGHTVKCITIYYFTDRQAWHTDRQLCTVIIKMRLRLDDYKIPFVENLNTKMWLDIKPAFAVCCWHPAGNLLSEHEERGAGGSLRGLELCPPRGAASHSDGDVPWRRGVSAENSPPRVAGVFGGAASSWCPGVCVCVWVLVPWLSDLIQGQVVCNSQQDQ